MLGLSRESDMARCVQEAIAQMTQPVPELDGLVLPVESKTGAVWGEMQ